MSTETQHVASGHSAGDAEHAAADAMAQGTVQHDTTGASSMPAIMPPGVGASAAEVSAYLSALGALPEGHSHAMGSGMAAEHMAAMNLVPRVEASHVAIGSGDWFDPSIWANGQIPGWGAKVLIPEGVTVSYGAMSNASLFTVRVDGALDFATDTSSQMVFDTLVVSATGRLTIGTEANPVQPWVDVDLVVADNGPIDVGWDPMLLSRGIIAHGETTIHGAAKDSHEKVAVDPMAGSATLRFAETPEGWQVGDTIVVAGTRYDGYKWDNDIRATRLYQNEDEVRVITGISPDGTVTIDAPLVHDHDTPRGDLKTSVANYTRSVTVETRNADNLPVHERGHVMFMHSDNVDVRYAAFHGLGRTDKSTDSMSVSSFGQTASDSNVQGRYALHLHRTGTDDLDNPTILEGNAVFGSPGWGIVHHDSNAVITNNATFNTFGAGYIAETGNETGAWIDNIAIFAQGQSWDAPKNVTNLSTFDTARSGDGFWFQGRMVASEDNIAASVNTGFVYFHRDGDGRMIRFGADLFDYPGALYNDPDLTAHETPILDFKGNETFAAKEGLHVVKANPNQGHDTWSHLKDFTAWNVVNGFHMEYTAHYILENFDLIGKEDSGFSPALEGISLGNNVSEVMVIGGRIAGFQTGIDFHKSFNADIPARPDQHDYVVVDTTITDVGQRYSNYDPALDRVMTSADLARLAPNLELEPIILGSGRWGSAAITGTKTDTLGTTPFPGGSDVFEIPYDAVQTTLAQNGFWETSGGQRYFLIDIYFTDRISGERYYETHPVFSPAGGGLWAGAFNGVQDIVTSGGVTRAGSVVLDQATQAVQNGGFSHGSHEDEQEQDRGDTGTHHHGNGQMVMGTDGNDALWGGQEDDTLNAGGGRDMLNGGAGDDILFGGSGIDTAVFAGTQTDYTLEIDASGATLTDRSAAEGSDRLTGV